MYRPNRIVIVLANPVLLIQHGDDNILQHGDDSCSKREDFPNLFLIGLSRPPSSFSNALANSGFYWKQVAVSYIFALQWTLCCGCNICRGIAKGSWGLWCRSSAWPSLARFSAGYLYGCLSVTFRCIDGSLSDPLSWRQHMRPHL